MATASDAKKEGCSNMTFRNTQTSAEIVAPHRSMDGLSPKRPRELPSATSSLSFDRLWAPRPKGSRAHSRQARAPDGHLLPLFLSTNTHKQTDRKQTPLSDPQYGSHTQQTQNTQQTHLMDHFFLPTKKNVQIRGKSDGYYHSRMFSCVAV